jgi:hypothetical protein
LGCSAKLIFVDEAAVRTRSGKERSTNGWLSRLQQSLAQLVAIDGFVAYKVTEESYSTIRLNAEKIFGRQQYVGTIVHRNPLADGTHVYELVVVFRPPIELPPRRIGLRTVRKYEHLDLDPRGPWRNPGHKGARSGGPRYAFGIRIPPYRWRLVSGRLPPGIWRLNPQTGVLWAPKLSESGSYRFQIEVTDSYNQKGTNDFEIVVSEHGIPPRLPENVWFLSAALLEKSNQPPRIVTRALQNGVIGQPYISILQAEGGEPFDEVKYPGKNKTGGERTRYWEFSQDSLVRGILEDRVIFNGEGKGNPSFKRFEADEPPERTSVELSWWDEERLQDDSMSARLVKLLSQVDEIVIDMSDDIEGLGRQALRLGRRVVKVGADVDPISASKFLQVCRLSSVIGTWDSTGRLLQLDYDAPDFQEAIAWLEGFLPKSFLPLPPAVPADVAAYLIGISLNGREACAILNRDEWVASERCSRAIETMRPLYARLYVYYYRGQPSPPPDGVVFRRIPFELSCRPRS